MTAHGRDFQSLRAQRGSQHQAFEELCYQLRDPTPDNNADIIKTGNPDAGLAWWNQLDRHDNEYTQVHDGEGNLIGLIGRNSRTGRLWYRQGTGEGGRGGTAENLTCHDDAE